MENRKELNVVLCLYRIFLEKTDASHVISLASLIDELEKLSGVKVPQAIEDIRSAAVLHDTVCETEDMCKEVKKILNIK